MKELTEDQLAALLRWAEEHEFHNPLADAYLQTCGLVGAVMNINEHGTCASDFVTCLFKVLPARGRWSVANGIEKSAFDLRDRIGMVIWEHVISADDATGRPLVKPNERRRL